MHWVPCCMSVFTARPAFRHATFAEAYEALKDSDYIDPAHFDVSEPICNAIRRALEPDVEHRVDSCEDLADLLQDRTPRSVRRRRRRVAVALVVLGVLAAGAGWWVSSPEQVLRLVNQALAGP